VESANDVSHVRLESDDAKARPAERGVGGPRAEIMRGQAMEIERNYIRRPSRLTERPMKHDVIIRLSGRSGKAERKKCVEEVLRHLACPLEGGSEVRL